MTHGSFETCCLSNTWGFSRYLFPDCYTHCLVVREHALYHWSLLELTKTLTGSGLALAWGQVPAHLMTTHSSAVGGGFSWFTAAHGFGIHTVLLYLFP